MKNKKMLKQSMLNCCKLYISESRNGMALESIERASKLYPDVAIVNKFTDTSYNRVGYTVVSHLAPDFSHDSPSGTARSVSLRSAVLAMVEAAFKDLNLESHCGMHPRLGVVDHICFHPLAAASLDQAARLAKSVAADIGNMLQVPTFLYGAAHHEGRTLDSIRRDLGYFKPNAEENQWMGGSDLKVPSHKPDEGPVQATRSKGVVVVGACPWVDNYNVPVLSMDIAAVRRIARKVSGRGGGLPSVQAMALAHGESTMEVACNLLDPDNVGADQVQLEVERFARDEGITVEKGLDSIRTICKQNKGKEKISRRPSKYEEAAQQPKLWAPSQHIYTFLRLQDNSTAATLKPTALAVCMT